MDAIITLAAIEYGKGNTDVSTLHIDGIKRLVQLRGGIDAVKRMSPLTARMVAWYDSMAAYLWSTTDICKGLLGHHANTAISSTRRFWSR